MIGRQEGRKTGRQRGDLLEDTVGETAQLHEHARVIRAQEGVAGEGDHDEDKHFEESNGHHYLSFHNKNKDT